MTDTATGDLPTGDPQTAGQEPAAVAPGDGAHGVAPARHGFAADGLPRRRPASDDYGLQPHRLAPPAPRTAGHAPPPDDDSTAPPELASLLRRHQPTRPTWTCASDGRPWPCAAARVHLRSQYAGDLVGLSMYMSRQLMTAAVDLADGGAPPPDLFRRFVAWT